MKFDAEEIIACIVALLLLAVIAGLLYRRKLLRQMPVFSLYVIYHFFYVGVLLYAILRRSYQIYFYVYWSTEFLDIIVILAVLYELVSKVLESYPVLQKAGSRLYAIATIVLGAVGLGMAISYHSVSISRFDDFGISAVRSLHFVELGVVFSLFVFCRVFGLAWRQYVFGVALGFGVKASMQTVGYSLWLQTGYPGNLIGGYIMSAAYTTGLLLWCYFLATAEKTVAVPTNGASPQLARWNSALEQLFVR